MASVTLTVLQQRVRTLADMTGSAFVSDAEITQFVNSGLDELYDLIVSKFQDYFVSSSNFTISGSTVALPSDFYKLLGVDMVVAGDTIALKKFIFKERNKLKNSDYYSPSEVPSYRIEGSNIRLYPQPNNGVTGTIWYVPQRTQLVNGSDSVNFPQAWEEYAVIDAAIKCLVKEESDVQELMAMKAAMRRAIEEASEARDADEPERVVDLDAPSIGRTVWSF